MQRDAAAVHRLAGADLGGLAAFGPSVDRHFAVGDQVFALAAAIGNAAELEQSAQLDMVGLQLKLQFIHYDYVTMVLWR